MHTPNGGSDEDQLDALFQAYREACPSPDPSVNFMPQLWQRIEARQTWSFFLGRMASGFVTAAVALTVVMAVYLYFPSTTSSAFYSESYVEALAGHSGDSGDFIDPVHLDLSDTAGIL